MHWDDRVCRSKISLGAGQAGNSETVELCVGRSRERKSRGHAPSPRDRSRGMSTGTPTPAAVRLRIYFYVILYYRSTAGPSTSALGNVLVEPPPPTPGRLGAYTTTIPCPHSRVTSRECMPFCRRGLKFPSCHHIVVNFVGARV